MLVNIEKNPFVFRKLMNEIFDHSGIDYFFKQGSSDVYEDECDYFIEMNVAGLKKEDIEISLENQQLKVTGKNLKSKNTDNSYQMYDRSGRYFEKAFSLPSTLQQDKITASYDAGILKIKLPKSTTCKPKQIKIS